jgi:NAD(P)-dependent dehydrogenase (short-subunit alcohol dehydrogenase family)
MEDSMNPVERFNLTGQVAIVTGAARGLGNSMAVGLAQVGASVVIADLNPDLAEAAAVSLQERDATAVAIPVDVTRPEQVQELVCETLRRFGRLDVFVNNAGVCKHIHAEEMSFSDWQQVIDVNLTGVFLGSQAAGREMMRQGRGSIVNIASMSGLVVNKPQPQCAYNASKAGVIMLTKSLAAEWACSGVRVNAIAPGYMNTVMSSPFFEDPEMGGVWMQGTPMARPGEPEELLGALVYLASDASSFMTGQVLVIDGGYTLW